MPSAAALRVPGLSSGQSPQQQGDHSVYKGRVCLCARAHPEPRHNHHSFLAFWATVWLGSPVGVPALQRSFESRSLNWETFLHISSPQPDCFARI